jgi:hypothetical protein
MVDEIYSDDIVMESMADPTRVVRGGLELHALEDELTRRVVDHRHELVRVTVAGSTACLETTVVAPRTGEYAPACVWWWVGADAKVAGEVGWFDWADRNTDWRVTHGTIPIDHLAGVADDHLRDQGWYRSFAESFIRTWTTDPLGQHIERFTAECTFGRVGQPEEQGRPALVQAQQTGLEALPLAERWVRLDCVIGEARVVAMLLTVGDAKLATRVTEVLTLDEHDKVVSQRTYGNWSKAVARSVHDDRPATPR